MSMAHAHRNRCHGILASGPNKGTRCTCNIRDFSHAARALLPEARELRLFCGRHQPVRTKNKKQKTNINIPDVSLIETLLAENKRLQDTNEFLREDVTGWMNEAEAIQDRANFFFNSSNRWTKIALQMNMLLQDIKRQSSADHIKMLCDQVDYMELPQELTPELYHAHDVGFNPYTDVAEEDTIDDDDDDIEIEE